MNTDDCTDCGTGHARDLQDTPEQAAMIAASDGGDRDGGTPIHDDVLTRHPNLDANLDVEPDFGPNGACCE